MNNLQPLEPPFIWFYSDLLLLDNYSYGQILTEDGWQNIYVSFKDATDMLVKNEAGELLIAGRILPDNRLIDNVGFVSMETYVDNVFGKSVYTFHFTSSLEARVVDSNAALNAEAPKSLLPDPGYWRLDVPDPTGDFTPPYIYFNSDRIFSPNSYFDCFGEILTDAGWQRIYVVWRDCTYMFIQDADGKTLISGHLKNRDESVLAGSTSFTIEIDTDSIYHSKTLTFVYSGDVKPGVPLK